MRDLSPLPGDTKIKAERGRKIRAVKREERTVKQIVSSVARDFPIYSGLSRATYDRSAHGWSLSAWTVALTLLMTEVLLRLKSKETWHGVRQA